MVIFMNWVVISSPLINICANRGHEVLVIDATNLLYRIKFGEYVISIVFLHHISSKDYGKRAIEEIFRKVC